MSILERINLELNDSDPASMHELKFMHAYNNNNNDKEGELLIVCMALWLYHVFPPPK